SRAGLPLRRRHRRRPQARGGNGEVAGAGLRFGVMHYGDLYRKLRDHPFKPFRIRLVNNTTYDIPEPWMVIPGDTSAVVVTHVRRDDKGYEIAEDWRTISIAHLLEFSDLARKN